MVNWSLSKYCTNILLDEYFHRPDAQSSLTLRPLCLFQTLKLPHHYQMKHLWSPVAQPFQTPLHILEPRVRNNTQQNHEPKNQHHRYKNHLRNGKWSYWLTANVSNVSINVKENLTKKNKITVLTHWNSLFSLFSVSHAEYRGSILEILEC